jgi:hypothetical protein
MAAVQPHPHRQAHNYARAYENADFCISTSRVLCMDMQNQRFQHADYRLRDVCHDETLRCQVPVLLGHGPRFVVVLWRLITSSRV